MRALKEGSSFICLYLVVFCSYPLLNYLFYYLLSVYNTPCWQVKYAYICLALPTFTREENHRSLPNSCGIPTVFRGKYVYKLFLKFTGYHVFSGLSMCFIIELLIVTLLYHIRKTSTIVQEKSISEWIKKKRNTKINYFFHGVTTSWPGTCVSATLTGCCSILMYANSTSPAEKANCKINCQEYKMYIFPNWLQSNYIQRPFSQSFTELNCNSLILQF